MWRKAMLYLGLGPDEEYEDGTASAGGPPPDALPPRRAAAEEAPPQRRPAASASGASVSQLPTQQQAVRPVQPGARPAAVRPVRPTAVAKPTVVAPRSFEHAQEVGERFRESQPVIMNLQGLPRELSRRLIDFASGLCFGLGGQMERVAVDVFLLTPAKMEVSKEERRRLQQRGLHDT